MIDYLVNLMPMVLPLTMVGAVAGVASVWYLTRPNRVAPLGEFWSGLTWVVCGLVGTPLIWKYGAPAAGWTLGGLGGRLYLLSFLPLNGLVSALGLLPLVGRVLRPLAVRRPATAAVFAGMLQLGVQAAQLVFVTRYNLGIGDLMP